MERVVYLTQRELLKSSIIDNPGNGDCLFYAISYALQEGLKWETSYASVEVLRKVVAENITESMWKDLCLIFEGALKEREISVLRDYSFMFQGRDSFEKLSEVIMTKLYWGDEMSLFILEKVLQINLHVLTWDSKEMSFRYKARMTDVLPRFKYNILLIHEEEKNPAHYTLMAYNKRVIMTKDLVPLCIFYALMNKWKVT